MTKQYVQSESYDFVPCPCILIEKTESVLTNPS